MQSNGSDVERLGGGWIMTEFGAAEDVRGDIYALEKSMQMADKHKQSWMYWQFKYYEDLTTCTPTGESLYQEDGTVCEHKLRVLSRTYPQAVAGSLDMYHFNPLDARFTLKYSLVTAAERATQPRSGTEGLQSADGLTTVVYFNRDLYYPHGANVEVVTIDGTPSTEVKVSCARTSSLISLVQAEPTADNAATAVTVTLSACRVNDITTCTCK